MAKPSGSKRRRVGGSFRDLTCLDEYNNRMRAVIGNAEQFKTEIKIICEKFFDQ